MDEQIKLRMERRFSKRRRILLVLPPSAKETTIEIHQGESRKADDYVMVPKGTRFERPSAEEN